MKLKWEDWEETYLDIVGRLGLDTDADRAATSLLSTLLRDTDSEVLLTELEERIRNRTIVVCGAGPSLERHLAELLSSEESDNLVFVAADGAVSALLNINNDCDILVTDLDGKLSDIRQANKTGTLTIVHAHGDNTNVVQRVVPELGEVLGSTQVEPAPNVFLWGGFTDGDRACHIVSHYSPKRVILAGMDFGSKVGLWSKPDHSSHFRASNRKQIKLQIADELISSLKETGKLEYTILR
ncbi:MAG: DUF115 domain-containing protein [Candidatus Thorarchaeota archaeon]|nr:MAG: DUF115 domain-containing protein [Candidatus Thorarchaeota archaeon]